jgi:hypothetical protein
MSPTSQLKKKIVHRTVFLILNLLFVLHSFTAFSADDLPTPASADDKLEEELKYLKAETYASLPHASLKT